MEDQKTDKQPQIIHPNIRAGFWLILIAGILAIFSGLSVLVAYGVMGFSLAQALSPKSLSLLHIILGIVFIISSLLVRKTTTRKLAGSVSIVASIIFLLFQTMGTSSIAWLLALIGGILVLTYKEEPVSL